MSATSLETLLARLYTDAPFRKAFLADPERIARAQGLDDAEIAALQRMDREGLEFAARSFTYKRAEHAKRRRSWVRRLVDRIRNHPAASGGTPPGPK